MGYSLSKEKLGLRTFSGYIVFALHINWIINVIEYCTVFLPKESKKIALFVNKFYLPVECSVSLSKIAACAQL